MSFGNLPVIKTLMSRTKRGHRVELTPDMISPPLGDFRHVMHVGRKGEVFGDTSFLSKHEEKRRQNRWNYLSQKLQQAGWINSARPSLRGRAGHPISPPPPISPIIKNAISLPLLANRSWDDEKEDDKDIDVDMWKWDSTCGNQSAHCTLPRASSSEEPSEDANSQKPEDDFGSAGFMENDDFSICTVPLELSCSLWRSDSMRSFVMDLGPSLMSEILEETGALHNDDLLQSFTQRSLSSNANEESILEFSQSLNDTQEPMSQQLITQEPMTQRFITQEPMSQQFITQEPMSQQFITQEPMSQQSLTQEPMSQQFITQEPMSQQFITQEPMSQQFITQEPMSQQFITQEPMSQQFITQEPMSQQFITQEPLSQGQTIQELTAREPTNQRTVNQEQAAYGLMIRKPMTKGSNANEAEPMTNNPKNIRAPALVSWEPPPLVEEMEVDWKGNLRSFNTGLDSIGVLWVSEEEPAIEM